MTDAAIGYGATIWVASALTPNTVDVKLAEVFSITPPNFTRDMVEATNFDSPNGYREYIPNLKDSGEVSFDLNWIPTNNTDDVLNVMKNETAPRKFEIRLSQIAPAAVIAFNGLLMEYSPSIPIDDRMTATVTLKVTGVVVTTP